MLSPLLKELLLTHGSIVQGDHLFSDKDIYLLTALCVDNILGEKGRSDRLHKFSSQLGNSYEENAIKEIISQNSICPNTTSAITDIIVTHRLKMFSPMLSTFGFNMHLITLPEFHVTAFNMHKLSDSFSKNGINAFVENVQRPERIYSENNNNYTNYNHHTAPGPGGEALFNSAVGSHDVNTLSDSTEQDDIKSRNN